MVSGLTETSPPETLVLNGRKSIKLTPKSQHLLDLEAKYTIGGFTPLPAFMESGKGAQLWVRRL